MVRAQVTEIIEEGEIDLGGTLQRYQVARVDVLEGEFQGIVREMDYGKRQILSNNLYLKPSDDVLVSIGVHPDGILTFYFADFVRLHSILGLTAIFAAAILVISRWKGLRSLVSMVLSLLIIIGYIIPRILAGGDPLWVNISVVLTTLIAILFVLRADSLQKWRPILGPERSGASHSH